MGLFDFFNKNKKVKTNEVDDGEGREAIGWQAIEQEFQRVYPSQTNPKHFGTTSPLALGGQDPLDGVSVYDGGDYWHFVTFGQTEIYEKESDDKEISGFGCELTFKLRKEGLEEEETELRCVCGILQSLARLAFLKGKVFRPNEFVYTGQTAGIDAERRSKITGFLAIKDPTVATIDTPNGRVEFLELVGATDAELKSVYGKEITVESLYAKIGTDV